MATPLDQNFLTGFSQGAGVVNAAQTNAMNLMGRIQEVVANRMQMKQAAKMFPYQLRSLQAQARASETQADAAAWMQEDRINQLEGTRQLASVMASITDWTDPLQVGRGYELVTRFPSIDKTGLYQSFEDRIRSAISAKTRIDVVRTMNETKPLVKTAFQRELEASPLSPEEKEQIYSEHMRLKATGASPGAFNSLLQQSNLDPDTKQRLIQARLEEMAGGVSKQDVFKFFSDFYARREKYDYRWNKLTDAEKLKLATDAFMAIDSGSGTQFQPMPPPTTTIQRRKYNPLTKQTEPTGAPVAPEGIPNPMPGPTTNFKTGSIPNP